MPSKAEFLKPAKIAIYGVSPKRKTFAAGVKDKLEKEGIETFPIHPDAPDGWYANLDSLPEKIESVYVCTGKKNTLSIVDDVINYGARKIWLQDGGYNKATIEKCKNAGLITYTGCLMMFIPNAGFPHSFHKFLVELFKGRQ
jgi:predicted CoA-binding protein